MLTLRDDQQHVLDEVRAHLRAGRKRVLVQAATGFGKTVLSAAMTGNAAGKGKRVWFLVHRRELIKQAARTFSLQDIDFGIIAAGFQQNRYMAVQIASIPTLTRRLDDHSAPDILIWDETHHVGAASWEMIFKRFPDAIHIGLSATPIRLDGRGLGDFYETMVCGPQIAWLIEQGFLSKYRLLAPGNNVNMAGIHKQAGDYNKKELEAALAASTITGDALAHYQKHASGRRALMFHVSVKRSLEAVEQFKAAGIPAEHVDGETDPMVRDSAIDRFVRGELLVISNVDLFGEGTDLPAVEVLIDCAPSMSLGRVMQRWGRVLRVADGKHEALILDHAGNSGAERHGFPDTEREWTLEGRAKKPKQKDEVLVRRCPECMTPQLIYTQQCKKCGFEFTREGRDIEEVDGELVEVDTATAQKMKRQEQARAHTEEELIALGRSRGMKRPELWARHVIRARKAKGMRT